MLSGPYMWSCNGLYQQVVNLKPPDNAQLPFRVAEERSLVALIPTGLHLLHSVDFDCKMEKCH